MTVREPIAQLAVAPHAGSVDRNQKLLNALPLLGESLPTRGAWIEIPRTRRCFCSRLVAPHAGSVDRNCENINHPGTSCPSLPTRGAWIEILDWKRTAPPGESLPTRGAWIEIGWLKLAVYILRVAPHAGSVDRNRYAHGRMRSGPCRSPRGERG